MHQGGTGVVCGHWSLTHISKHMLMPQSHVIPACVADLLCKDGRGTVRLLARRIEKAVRHGDMPALVMAGGDVCQRMKARRMFFHGPPPHHQIELRKLEHLPL